MFSPACEVQSGFQPGRRSPGGASRWRGTASECARWFPPIVPPAPPSLLRAARQDARSRAAPMLRALKRALCREACPALQSRSRSVLPPRPSRSRNPWHRPHRPWRPCSPSRACRCSALLPALPSYLRRRPARADNGRWAPHSCSFSPPHPLLEDGRRLVLIVVDHLLQPLQRCAPELLGQVSDEVGLSLAGAGG